MESELTTVPPLFQDAREYKDDPEALEAAQRTYHEVAIYDALVEFAQAWFNKYKRPARVLDLCAATGLCSARIADHIPIEFLTLVDTDLHALARARSNLKLACPVRFVGTDAISFRDQYVYDLVLMNSAYHHIGDNSKIAFLSSARLRLSPNGVILLGEHFLPPYVESTYRESVAQYYTGLIADLGACGEPGNAISVIRRAGLYCWMRTYEFKVSWQIFVSHAMAARLTISELRHVPSLSFSAEFDPLIGPKAVLLR